MHKTDPFLTWTLTGSIQCSKVSVVTFSGSITGSLGGMTHNGEHTAPEGMEVYNRAMDLPNHTRFQCLLSLHWEVYTINYNIMAVIGRADFCPLRTCRVLLHKVIKSQCDQLTLSFLHVPPPLPGPLYSLLRNWYISEPLNTKLISDLADCHIPKSEL